MIKIKPTCPYKVDYFNYYRSETIFTDANKPAPTDTIQWDATEYIDQTTESGKQYYVAIGAVKNGVEKLSDVIYAANDIYHQYVYLYESFTTEIPVKFNQVGTNHSIQTNAGAVGNGYYQCGNASYLLFDMPDFFNTIPFCIELYSNSPATGVGGIASFGASMSDYANASVLGDYWYSSTNNINWTHPSISHGAPKNVWVHHAFSWDGSTMRVFMNGTLKYSASISSWTQTKNNGIIGRKSDALSDSVINKIQHLRLTKGVARYINNFIPPVVF